ncbi:hypothetical protein NPIL_131211 [Nephila pilipes]|uniref:Uncharacterized protein n=1 Tax=Nephila pilipes TaxID=299642 RepID=A0A8X6PNW6_NEPPI|nr:hypothetical protein NPIL_131211 [Nephila pilipes]
MYAERKEHRIPIYDDEKENEDVVEQFLKDPLNPRYQKLRKGVDRGHLGTSFHKYLLLMIVVIRGSSSASGADPS